MKAIRFVFPRAKNLICAWHVNQNFKKRFAFLNRGTDQNKKDLYNKIIQLPYTNYQEQFLELYNEIINSELLSEELKKYLKSKYATKDSWVKAHMKSYFCCGNCTTSRIEAKHRTYKRYLNSTKRLIEIFQCFKELESKEIKKYKDEVVSFSKKEKKILDKSKIVKFFCEDYSNFAVLKIKEELINSTNYSITKKSNTLW